MQPQPDGTIRTVNYLMILELRFKLIPESNGVTVKLGCRKLHDDWGFTQGGFADGQIIWRYAGDSAWNVLDSFTSGSGDFAFRFASLQPDEDGYFPLYAHGSIWSQSIPSTSGRTLEIGFRNNPSSGSGFYNFGVAFTGPYARWGYGFSSNSNPIYKEAEVGPSGGIVYFDINGSFQPCTVWVDNGSEWIQAQPHVDNGSTWLPCG